MKKTYKLDKDTPEKTFAIFDYMGWDIEEMINEIAKENTYTVIVPRREDDLRTIQIINGGKLTHWSAKDEKLMQTLMVKESPGKWEIVNGVNTKVVVSKNMFSDELKELIA